MSPKTIEFTLLYHYDSRIRHFHRLDKNIIVEFCLQPEVYFDNQWHPVIRYDTAHGFAHKDVLSKNGKVNKEPLFITDYNEALTFAENDIRSNWEIYRDKFFKEENINE